MPPRKVNADSDEEEVVVKKPVVAPAAKPAARRVKADDSDDEEVPAAKPAAAAAAAAKPAAARRVKADDSDEEEAAPKKAAPAARHADPTAAAAAASSSPPAARLNYDALAYDAFLKLLEQRTVAEVCEAVRARQQEERAAREELERAQIEHFSDGSAGGYAYTMLLERVFSQLRANNPSLTSTEQQRNQLIVPEIERFGSKKTAIPNFKKICDALHRTMEEVKDFIDKELSTVSSIDSSNCLILKQQNVKAMQFEGLIIKYVDEYVKCHSCRKIDSRLEREDRLLVLHCNLCKATRTVQAATSATYQASTTKRAKVRLQMAL